ncbi:MAG: hypothetical protein ACRBN8_14515 [Nannocystales bacterium]
MGTRTKPRATEATAAGDSRIACRQLEVRVALSSVDGATEDDVRQLVGRRLAHNDQAAPVGLDDVDIAIGDCLRWGSSTHSIWQAVEHGMSIGALMLDVYRDGFVEGYRDALGHGPTQLVAE